MGKGLIQREQQSLIVIVWAFASLASDPLAWREVPTLVAAGIGGALSLNESPAAVELAGSALTRSSIARAPCRAR